MPGLLRLLLPAALAAIGCGHRDAPDDPALAAPTGIPEAAPNASGVQLEMPAVPSPPSGAGHTHAPHPSLVPDDPLTPFDPHPADGGAFPTPHKTKGMQL